MDQTKAIYNQNFIDGETLKKINEHALLYEGAHDKKDFLRNISLYEQKIILMNSSKPYDVLNYLDELDLKATRLLLEELSFDEIKHIISLFSSEDKKKFYATFSDLSFVNQFIVQDKNSSEHVENLSFERKVELLNSSDKETQVATSVIYESMPVEERVVAAEKVTDVDASYTLESTNVYSETQEQAAANEEGEQSHEIVEEVQMELIQEVETSQDNQSEKVSEEVQEDPKEQTTVSESLEKEGVQEFSNKESNLSSNAKETIVEGDLTILEQFQQEKIKCEQLEIQKLLNQTPQKNSEFASKTL